MGKRLTISEDDLDPPPRQGSAAPPAGAPYAPPPQGQPAATPHGAAAQGPPAPVAPPPLGTPVSVTPPHGHQQPPGVAAQPAQPPPDLPRLAARASQPATGLAALAPLIPAAAGMAGIGIGWFFTEVFVWLPGGTPTTKTGAHVLAAAWIGLMTVFFTFVVAGWEALLKLDAGRLKLLALRVLPAALAIGIVAGVIASVLYIEVNEALFGDLTPAELQNFDVEGAWELYLSRAASWGVFGAGVGVVMGVASLSLRKVALGAAGGAIGGAVGGLVFHWLSFKIGSDVFARLIGLLAVGVCVSLATSAVETLLREAWISVIGGGLRGKQFILYHERTRVGSDPDCELYLLKDPRILPVHLVIDLRPDGRRLLTAAPGAEVLVNGQHVMYHVLNSDDLVQLGGTTLHYLERTTPTR